MVLPPGGGHHVKPQARRSGSDGLLAGMLTNVFWRSPKNAIALPYVCDNVGLVSV